MSQTRSELSPDPDPGVAPELAGLPSGNVVEVLLEQHESIRDLFAMVKEAEDGRRKQWFDELRQLLAVHETGEQKVLRPMTREVLPDEVVAARVQEETALAEALGALEKIDVDSPQFAVEFAELERAVTAHAGCEESLEFPALVAERSPDVLQELGRLLVAGQAAASARQQSGFGGIGADAGFQALLTQAREAFAEDWPEPLQDGIDRIGA